MRLYSAARNELFTQKRINCRLRRQRCNNGCLRFLCVRRHKRNPDRELLQRQKFADLSKKAEIAL
jgi:hypothetical protein